MLLPLGNTILRCVLRIAFFSTILILGGIPCLWSRERTVVVLAVGPASGPPSLPEAQSTGRSSRSATADLMPDYEKPPSGAEFAKACYDLVTNYTYSAIVAHNMDVKAAAKMHQGRDKKHFLELAANLTKTIMKFVEQLDQIGVLFSENGDNVPLDMYRPISCTPERIVEQTDDSNTVVPWLILVILVLFMYIGYLSYRMKMKYHRNTSPVILIEDH